MTATMLEQAISAAVDATDSRRAQVAWAATPLAERLKVLKRFRQEFGRASARTVDAIPRELVRSRADSYGAEVLPVLAACRFLEKHAAKILKQRKLGTTIFPFWMAGIGGVVKREPLGVVLVIAAANYPLFLAGVQTLQALAAGNAVVWKPGRNSQPLVETFREAFARAGLPEGVLRVTDDSVESATRELLAHPDKVVFTGSGDVGREVLRLTAQQAIPAVTELSGCDAVIVLPSADMNKAIEALVFGMRLNGSSTCMAPRRLFLVGGVPDDFISKLCERFAAVDGIEVAPRTREQLRTMVAEAERQGATICGDAGAASLKPVLVLNGRPEMRIAQADIFAPVITTLRAADGDEVLRQDRHCPFGLSASIFGEEREALELGRQLHVGNVIVNDVMVPTVDPRVTFGGRRGSGFGTTRGAEGLLEMTAARTTLVRKGSSTLQYQKTTEVHEDLFRSEIALSHGATLRERFAGLRGFVAAAKKLK
jgi:acyl-CoA reductase-like NAD-dependent aldehyde dehydrogenase